MHRAGLLLGAALLAFCGVARGEEGADFGVAPTRELRLADHASPTPREIPDARTISTGQLQDWLRRSARERPLLIDVIGGDGHESLPGAVWLPGAGRGESLNDSVQERLGRALKSLTAGDLKRPVVFFCASVRCWLSYNAVLRATKLGYREVYWYRGGIQAWIDAGGDLQPMQIRP